ncbi:hypothetical protein K474DRAFT_1660710 [Panus rudis PR-1116 ss-1]|nr:hypothetical protein K474DRAFT_1660710 [Panus rudis PR-1116 ss-1]
MANENANPSAQASPTDVSAQNPAPASAVPEEPAPVTGKRQRPDGPMPDWEYKYLFGKEALEGWKEARQKPPPPMLPEPTKDYIEVRIQLFRFHNVYRYARLPVTMTFQQLYKFLLYIFGWSGAHLHRFEVVGNVEMYSPNGQKKGMIKKCGRYLPEMPDPHDIEDPREWIEWWMLQRHHSDPYIEVVSKLPKYPRSPRPPPYDEEWHYYDPPLETEVRLETELTIGDVWDVRTPDRRRNATKGECNNRKIGIRMEYDLGASWEVHITLSDLGNSYVWQSPTPNNKPTVIQAKGAPPVEDCPRERYDEPEGKKKGVSGLIYDPENFVKYLKGEIGSRARKTELAIYDVKKENERLRKLAKEREEKRAAREAESARHRAEGNEDSEGDDDEDEYYSNSEDDYY